MDPWFNPLWAPLKNWERRQAHVGNRVHARTHSSRDLDRLLRLGGGAASGRASDPERNQPLVSATGDGPLVQPVMGASQELGAPAGACGEQGSCAHSFFQGPGSIAEARWWCCVRAGI